MAPPKILEEGFECSDMSSWYTLHNGKETGHNVQSTNHISDGDTVYNVEMAHGAFEVIQMGVKYTCKEESPHHYTYGWKLLTAKPTWFYDMVVRMVFPKDCEARIAGRTLGQNHDTVRYWQYAVDECKIGPMDIHVHCQPPEGWIQELYVRAAGDTWVVHARLMPDPPMLDVLKFKDGHSEFWHGTPAQREKLFRRREIEGADYETQLQPHRLVPTGTKVWMHMTAST